MFFMFWGNCWWVFWKLILRSLMGAFLLYRDIVSDRISLLPIFSALIYDWLLSRLDFSFSPAILCCISFRLPNTHGCCSLASYLYCKSALWVIFSMPLMTTCWLESCDVKWSFCINPVQDADFSASLCIPPILFMYVRKAFSFKSLASSYGVAFRLAW